MLAQAAQAAAEAALAESEAKKIELDQQFKFLRDTEAKTAAAYEEGERKRKEEEERRRQSGGSRSGCGRRGSGRGRWRRRRIGRRRAELRLGEARLRLDLHLLRPARGHLRRRLTARTPFHYAVDIATGCSAPIYAAASGTVVYAGWNGGYGNFILITTTAESQPRMGTS